MKKFIFLLLLLPSLSFACPVLNGHFACAQEDKSVIDFHIKTEGNTYIINMDGVEGEITWVADGTTKTIVKPTGEGDIIHTGTMSCEGNKLKLTDSQKMYHDKRAVDIKPGDVADIEQSFIEYLYLNETGNLVQEDHITFTRLGKTRIKDITVPCTKIKEK